MIYNPLYSRTCQTKFYCFMQKRVKQQIMTNMGNRKHKTLFFDIIILFFVTKQSDLIHPITEGR